MAVDVALSLQSDEINSIENGMANRIGFASVISLKITSPDVILESLAKSRKNDRRKPEISSAPATYRFWVCLRGRESVLDALTLAGRNGSRNEGRMGLYRTSTNMDRFYTGFPKMIASLFSSGQTTYAIFALALG